MQTFPIGDDSPEQRHMYGACRSALDAMTAATLPGRPLGDIDSAHRRVLDEAGYRHARMSACGYSIGATYRPNWMDVPPMLYAGNPTPAAPGMVLFMHVILADDPHQPLPALRRAASCARVCCTGMYECRGRQAVDLPGIGGHRR